MRKRLKEIEEEKKKMKQMTEENTSNSLASKNA
jgi:hypothetical protein